MILSSIAPRLARARDQVVETERVLGWLRDNSWTGGAYVLVPGAVYGRPGMHWVYVERVVQGDAAPYPIRGWVDTSNWFEVNKTSGQWAFWEVAGIRLLSDDYPELLEMHPTFPRPREDMRIDPTSWVRGVNQGVLW